MDFKIRDRKGYVSTENYSKEDLDISREFAKKAYKEFGVFIKSIVLFGSSAKKPEHHRDKNSDIDILIIVNDLTTTLSSEVSETYRVIVEKLIIQTSRRIHLTTLTFTNFWEYMRVGDPIAVNILRDGIALLDTGFFDPLQALLYQGRIRPTYESIHAYYQRAPSTLQNSKSHIIQATLDLYWAVIDAAHAALMKVGCIPPSPSHVSELLDQKLVEKGHLHKEYSKIMKDFYVLSKKIVKRQIPEITGAAYDKYYILAKHFVEEMKRIIDDKPSHRKHKK